MHGLVRRLRAGRGAGGFTLIELIAVMIILSVVLGGLTTVFVSGSKAELELNNRFQSQQNARLALDRIRREVHCASALTPTSATPVSSVTITLPASCPGTSGAAITVTYATVSVGSGRYRLERNGVRVADYLTAADVFSFTVPSASTLGRLHVDLPVNVTPNEGWKQWRLVDDIVLRNTVRA